MGTMTCDDNRFEAIAKAREMLVSGTNIEDSPDEMAVLDTILFRFWQMGWIDALDVNERLKAENAKLREYVRILTKATVYDPCEWCQHDGDGTCDVETMPMRDGCKLYDELRELGVEVDA